MFPIHADARSLPFAADFFDAVVSIDFLVYYGTDDLYLNYLTRFVKPGGQMGIAAAIWATFASLVDDEQNRNRRCRSFPYPRSTRRDPCSVATSKLCEPAERTVALFVERLLGRCSRRAQPVELP